MLVLWNNMDEIGAPNEQTLHEGVPVTAGTKYIVTKWFRERFWG
jgi:prolyl 4-hydroxylase